MLSKEEIYNLLIQCKEDCRLRATINKAIEPFIIINPECKADEIYEALKKKRGKGDE